MDRKDIRWQPMKKMERGARFDVEQIYPKSYGGYTCLNWVITSCGQKENKKLITGIRSKEEKVEEEEDEDDE